MPTTFDARRISPAIFNESYRYVTYPSAAGEDFEKGAPVFLDDGEINECAAGTAVILGFATADADQYDWKEDTWGHVVPAVPVALATGVFRGTLSSSAAGAWEEQWDPDMIGDEYGLAENADGIWVIDTELDGGDSRVVIVGVDDEVEEDDINPPVLFVVESDFRQVVS